MWPEPRPNWLNLSAASLSQAGGVLWKCSSCVKGDTGLTSLNHRPSFPYQPKEERKQLTVRAPLRPVWPGCTAGLIQDEHIWRLNHTLRLAAECECERVSTGATPLPNLARGKPAAGSVRRLICPLHVAPPGAMSTQSCHRKLKVVWKFIFL